MALLNSGIENLQQMPMPSAGMKSADPSILEQILGAAKSAAPYLLPGIALPAMAISDALDARSRNQQAMKDTQGMDYGQLAQYWAARDPEKAAKYAEIAQSQQPKGYGQTFTSGGRIYQLTTDAGKPVDLGPAPAEAPKFSISGGYITQNGIPVSELPMSARDRAQEARANAQLALSRASAAREEAKFKAEQAASPAVKASEDERKAAGWLNQARKAYGDMQAALAQDKTAAVPGLVEQYSPIAEMQTRSMSPARQKYSQAASAFSEAVLRAATGAGVTADEARQKIRELTPQRGDAADVIQQKTASQAMYLQSLESRAGRAAGQAAPAQQKIKRYNPATGRIE